MFKNLGGEKKAGLALMGVYVLVVAILALCVLILKDAIFALLMLGLITYFPFAVLGAVIVLEVCGKACGGDPNTSLYVWLAIAGFVINCIALCIVGYLGARLFKNIFSKS